MRRKTGRKTGRKTCFFLLIAKRNGQFCIVMYRDDGDVLDNNDDDVRFRFRMRRTNVSHFFQENATKKCFMFVSFVFTKIRLSRRRRRRRRRRGRRHTHWWSRGTPSRWRSATPRTLGKKGGKCFKHMMSEYNTISYEDLNFPGEKIRS